MTKRYFITDPLMAAMAARDFGFKFKEGFSAQFLALDAATQIRDKAQPPKYYLHPDSERLLQPQEGDLIDFMGFVGRYVFNKYQNLHELHNTWAIKRITCELLEDIDFKPIILQRNNQPFPQVESEDI